MTVSDLVRQAADVYCASGNPLTEGLKPLLLRSLDTSAAVEPGSVPALSQLETALSAHDAHPIARTIAELADDLLWLDVRAMQELEQTRDRHAYVEIVGPEGVFASQDVRFGLYLQSADTVYPDHRHAAVELYYVVSGTAQWSKGEEPFAPQAPGTLIHHQSMQKHATTTLAEPLLAMWIWIGDISADSYEVSGVPGL